MSRQKRYNILFLMTERHRAPHVGVLPGSRCETPPFDRSVEVHSFLDSNQSTLGSAHEELFALFEDPHEQEYLIDSRRHLDTLHDLRARRTLTIDASPPAQTSWVPRQT
jgi:hypothetical protein